MVASSPNQKASKRIGPTESALLAFMAVGFLLLAVVGVPGGGGGPAIVAGGPTTPSTPSRGIGDLFRSMLPRASGTTIRDDFRSGLSDWAGAVSGAGDWSIQSGFVRPGRLRLWQKSMNMTDYYLEFQAQIERKSVSWAFRAKDSENYYAPPRSTSLNPVPCPAPTWSAMSSWGARRWIAWNCHCLWPSGTTHSIASRWRFKAIASRPW